MKVYNIQKYLQCLPDISFETSGGGGGHSQLLLGELVVVVFFFLLFINICIHKIYVFPNLKKQTKTIMVLDRSIPLLLKLNAAHYIILKTFKED